MRSRLSRSRLLGATALFLAVGSATPTAVAPASADVEAASGAHASAPAASTWKASLAVSRKTLDVGQEVVVSGTVFPKTSQVRVSLQKRLEGTAKWVSEKEVRTGSGGRFFFTDPPARAGKRDYRVVVPAQLGRAKGTSPVRTATVFRTFPLTEIAIRGGSATSRDTASVGGRSLPDSVVGGTYANRGNVDWNLDRRCTRLVTVLGNGDDSDDLATAQTELLLDGTSIFDGSFGLTQSTRRTFDLTGGFRLAFNWTSQNPESSDPRDTSGAQAVLGSPMVRCSF